MNPTIGVGFVSGLLESSFRKPRISDLENLQDDAGSVKGWYRNRVMRILLVFLLSSLEGCYRHMVGYSPSFDNLGLVTFKTLIGKGSLGAFSYYCN